ncbi:MAG: hypothetical protein LH647_08885, partial [Leptolyngbyaceae cyanobacterium CAN_BIN12]|nr:hypothetical protein [Leptolyngbyaceae cyanobacterium CAN_BIN12]
TVLTQFPHHTMTQATNFTDQITDINLKLLNINSIFSDCLHNYCFFTVFCPFPVWEGVFGDRVWVWLSLITVDVLKCFELID